MARNVWNSSSTSRSTRLRCTAVPLSSGFGSSKFRIANPESIVRICTIGALMMMLMKIIWLGAALRAGVSVRPPNPSIPWRYALESSRVADVADEHVPEELAVEAAPVAGPHRVYAVVQPTPLARSKIERRHSQTLAVIAMMRAKSCQTKFPIVVRRRRG
jgi:hypothetical protein